MERKRVFSIWYFVAAFFPITSLQDRLAPQYANNLPYSDFKALLRAGKTRRPAPPSTWCSAICRVPCSRGAQNRACRVLFFAPAIRCTEAGGERTAEIADNCYPYT